jgi:hypothetical protein
VTLLPDPVEFEQLLAPPDPDHRFRLAGGFPLDGIIGQTVRLPAVADAAHVWFQLISGTYDFADSNVVGLLLRFQYSV